MLDDVTAGIYDRQSFDAQPVPDRHLVPTAADNSAGFVGITRHQRAALVAGVGAAQVARDTDDQSCPGCSVRTLQGSLSCAADDIRHLLESWLRVSLRPERVE